MSVRSRHGARCRVVALLGKSAAAAALAGGLSFSLGSVFAGCGPAGCADEQPGAYEPVPIEYIAGNSEQHPLPFEDEPSGTIEVTSDSKIVVRYTSDDVDFAVVYGVAPNYRE